MRDVCGDSDAWAFLGTLIDIKFLWFLFSLLCIDIYNNWLHWVRRDKSGMYYSWQYTCRPFTMHLKHNTLFGCLFVQYRYIFVEQKSFIICVHLLRWNGIHNFQSFWLTPDSISFRTANGYIFFNVYIRKAGISKPFTLYFTS